MFYFLSYINKQFFHFFIESINIQDFAEKKITLSENFWNALCNLSSAFDWGIPWRITRTNSSDQWSVEVTPSSGIPSKLPPETFRVLGIFPEFLVRDSSSIINLSLDFFTDSRRNCNKYFSRVFFKSSSTNCTLNTGQILKKKFLQECLKKSLKKTPDEKRKTSGDTVEVLPSIAWEIFGKKVPQ